MPYEIENANNHNLSKMAIKEQLDRSAERACSLLILNMLIVSLILYWSNNFCFLNKDTGKVTLGMTGTNIQGEAFKKLKEGEFSRQNVTNAFEQLKMDMQILKYYILLHLIKTIDMRIHKNL